MQKNIISLPLHCHLWGDHTLNRQMLSNSLVTLKIFEDSSHLTRKLMQCTECRQLYFYEFHELIDWEEGNDAMYYKWIPVTGMEEAEKLHNLKPVDLLQIASIRVDFPPESEKPTTPYFISF